MFVDFPDSSFSYLALQHVHLFNFHDIIYKFLKMLFMNSPPHFELFHNAAVILYHKQFITRFSFFFSEAVLPWLQANFSLAAPLFSSAPPPVLSSQQLKDPLLCYLVC